MIRLGKFRDGSVVEARNFTGLVGASQDDSREWESVEIYIRPGEEREATSVCAVEYEDGIGYRLLVFEEDKEAPVFILPLKFGIDVDAGCDGV